MKARIKGTEELLPIADFVETYLYYEYSDDGELEDIQTDLSTLRTLFGQLIAILFEKGSISEDQFKTFIKIRYGGEVEISCE